MKQLKKCVRSTKNWGVWFIEPRSKDSPTKRRGMRAENIAKLKAFREREFLEVLRSTPKRDGYADIVASFRINDIMRRALRNQSFNPKLTGRPWLDTLSEEEKKQRRETIKAGWNLALYMEKSKRYIFDGDFFIVPNRAEKVENYAPHVRSKAKRLARFNKIELAPDDQVVEVWITNEDTDNLVDHGIHVHSLTTDDEWIRPTCGLLPLKLIKSVKEGESVDILMPCIGNNLLICRLTAAQRKYRYKNFGSFEDALLVAAGW